jgi:hypothetical protein
MKGVVILPKYLSKEWLPKIKVSKDGYDFSNVLTVHAPFYYEVHKNFGFELRYSDEIDVDYDTDIVFMFGVPYHNRPTIPPGLLDLNKKIKLVIYTGDVQCYNNKICLDNRIKIYTRCDMILSQSHEYFMSLYPQFASKFEFMPLFFSPHNRYVNLPFNKKPKLRCLLSGSINPSVYPLRSDIVSSKKPYIDYKPPTFVGDAYAKLLNSYFCCVMSASIFNYVLAKYFEITATGSLLLANETVDSGLAGFIPYEHYIPITKDNVYEQITKCLKEPERFDSIRKAGMNFSRHNHSVINRIDRLKKIFDKLVV